MYNWSSNKINTISDKCITITGRLDSAIGIISTIFSKYESHFATQNLKYQFFFLFNVFPWRIYWRYDWLWLRKEGKKIVVNFEKINNFQLCNKNMKDH